MEEIRQLEKLFFDRFGKYPLITFENVGWGMNYIIHKAEFVGNIIPYMKLGNTLSFATGMINGWKQIPQGLMTFETLAQRNAFNFGRELDLMKEDLWR